MAARATAASTASRPAKIRIANAARELFARNGYAATSIREIAESAGVAVPTVYWAYKTKRAIADAIRAAWVGEQTGGAGLQAILDIQDPHERLDAFAAYVRRRWETARDVIGIDEEARRTEPLTDDVDQPLLEDHGRDVARVLEPLARSLRRGVSPADARDVLSALSSYHVYRELTARHWSGKRYQQWLSRTARESLLGVDRPWWTATIEP